MMNDTGDTRRTDDLTTMAVVEDLNEEVKTMALNLAVYLAKARAQSGAEDLARMEPDVVRLVNQTIKVVREVALILSAARNQETMVYEVPSAAGRLDRIEFGLRGILEQCSQLSESLARAKKVAT